MVKLEPTLVSSAESNPGSIPQSVPLRETLMTSSGQESKDDRTWMSIPTLWERTPAFLRMAGGFLLAASFSYLLIMKLLAPELVFGARGLSGLLLGLIGAGTWLLGWRGKIDAASLFLIFGLWAYVTGMSIFAGGLRSNLVFTYPLIIFAAGWRMGLGYARFLAGATVAACLGFYLAESMGVLPVAPANPPALPFIALAAMVHVRRDDDNCHGPLLSCAPR